MTAISRTQQYKSRYEALKAERQYSLAQWKEVADNVSPQAYRYLAADRLRAGMKQSRQIINSVPVVAARTASAGMMSGCTSPARPWFRLGIPMMGEKSQAVKAWLVEVEGIIRECFAKSNIYQALQDVFDGLIRFGVQPMYVEEDDEDDVRAYTFPVGQYCLANSARLAIDTVYREFEMSVGQLVEKFGRENCSDTVKTAHNEGRFDEYHSVLHIIEPNRNYKKGALGKGGKRWNSCWLEMKADDDKFLRESGFEEFPVMAPRWGKTGEDVYASSYPGSQALGDMNALQLRELRKAQLVDKIANPPMVGPAALQSQRISLLPGATTFVPGVGGMQKFEPVFQVNAQALPAVEAEIVRLEGRIKKVFYADLWLLLSESDGQMTAREVIERRDEKLLQLGAVLESLQDELLDPLIARTYAILLRRGKIPPPPREIAGMDFRVEYISIMVAAQKVQGTTAVERLTNFVGALAGIKPDALDKLDTDEIVDGYSEMLGTPPTMVRPGDAVAGIRDARNKQAQQQTQMQQGMAAAKTAKDLAGADTEGNNALTTMLKGYGVA